MAQKSLRGWEEAARTACCLVFLKERVEEVSVAKEGRGVTASVTDKNKVSVPIGHEEANKWTDER